MVENMRYNLPLLLAVSTQGDRTLALENLGYPRVHPIVQNLCKFLYRITNWNIDNRLPNQPKMVLVFAPHTTNWDFIYVMLAAFSIGIKPQWMGKDVLFRGPLKWLFGPLGGIPVDRSKPTNKVAQTVMAIEMEEQVIIGIAPEATRSKSKYWKSGFYHIAHLAKIPINFAYIDFPSKTTGFAPGFIPCGDQEADVENLQKFFSDKRGKFPQKIGKIRFRPQKA
jgi:1-acyl-sn-glycerol-3-phosphate acyltransferase